MDHLSTSTIAPSVREELVHFLMKQELVEMEVLNQVCERAGFVLEELVG